MMTIKEKREQILYAQLATSEHSTRAECWFFTEKVDVAKLKEILEDHSLWSGYQRYNQLMREQGETDYKNLNEREVQQIKARLEWIIR